MAKTKFEEMFDRLPSNIKETEILRLSSKKVLAALLELLLHSDAKGSRIIYCQNSRLRKISGINSNELLSSIEQLIDYDLITRKVGKAKGEASEYTINFKKLKEPLVEKTFDDLFNDFFEDTKSLEKPINTPITIPITTTITNTISNSITNTIPITTSTSTSKTKEIKFKDGTIAFFNEKFNKYIYKINETSSKETIEEVSNNKDYIVC